MGKETKNITSYPKIIPEAVIQCNKNRKEEHEKAIVEQQRVLWIIQKLFEESVYIKRWHNNLLGPATDVFVEFIHVTD